MTSAAPTPHTLLTPGPTPIHPLAAQALGREMLGHMDPVVFALNLDIQRGLRRMYGAPGTFTALLAGTGSLGMEAGFANLVEDGDEVIVCANGSFGQRMAEMARRYGARVRLVTAPLGEAIRTEDVAAQLDDTVKMVAVVHGETSTGVLNPVPEIAALLRGRDTLLTVDAVTTAGMEPFHMHDWGVDYAYTGAQKCLSAPPGLAPIAVSDRAFRRFHARRAPTPLWYADLEGLRDYWERHTYHHTVPVNLHYALHAALNAALEEGLDARQARAAQIGAAAYRTLEPLGFRHYVRERSQRLPTVLALRLPEGLNDAAVRAELRQREISVTGGLGPTAGVIWRLGLMGETARPAPYRTLMTALEDILGQPGLTARFAEALEALEGTPAATPV